MSKMLKDTHKMVASVHRWVTLTQVAKETGLLISWLSAFNKNEIDDPGIKKVEKLYNYLKILPTLEKPSVIQFSEISRIHHIDDKSGIYIIWSEKTCIY